MCILADIQTLTVPQLKIVLCSMSLPEALATVSDSAVSRLKCKMHTNTFLSLVHEVTALMKSMCACSALGQLVLSELLHMIMSLTVCKMLRAFSKFSARGPSQHICRGGYSLNAPGDPQPTLGDQQGLER